MTPEERRLLTDLASKVSQTPPPQRDPEAEEFIRRNIGSRPDALYLMTQTVLVQNMAIEQAQQQIRELQQRAAQPQPAGTGSFLGGQTSGYAQQPPLPYAPSQQQPAYAPPQPSGSGFGGGGAPSFLRGAAQTAAGVAAGALAFEGVRSLFSHPGFGLGSGLGFGQAGLMGGGMPVEETVVNNYYDSPDGGGRGFGQHAEHLADVSDQSDSDQNSNDDSDIQTQDADYDDSGDSDDSSSFDDSSDSIA